MVRRVNAPPVVMVHTPVVLEVKVTVSPELAVAVSDGVVPKFCAPGLLKVMVWPAMGVTLLDAAEAELVPAPLLAGAVKATVAWVLPAVAVPMVGAPGMTALTEKLWVTVAAAK